MVHKFKTQPNYPLAALYEAKEKAKEQIEGKNTE